MVAGPFRGVMAGWTNSTHILILLRIAVLVSGAKKLPDIGRGLGSGIREFKGENHRNDASRNETFCNGAVKSKWRGP